jgi:hypothetical protein
MKKAGQQATCQITTNRMARVPQCPGRGFSQDNFPKIETMQ